MQLYLKLLPNAGLALFCYWVSWQLQAVGQPGLSLLVLIVASVLNWTTLIALVDLSAKPR